MPTIHSGLTQLRRDFGGKKVLIFGLGLLGKGINDAIFFHQLGAQVRVTDKKTASQLAPSVTTLARYPIEMVLGRHRRCDIEWAQIVIRSPAVRPDSPWMKQAARSGKPVMMDTALFCRYSRIPVIGVTGTRGKSTTAALIARILQAAGYPVLLGGNLPGQATLPLIRQVTADSWAVLELSSWDLQGLDAIRYSPPIAVMTNLYPDHLNYYPSMVAYRADKQAIGRYQKRDDYLIVNRRFPRLVPPQSQAHKIWYDLPARPYVSPLPGQHNQENMAAAAAVAKLMKIPVKIQKQVFRRFTGLPYRLQSSLVQGIRVINDTTSTTPTATLKALATISQPVYLILGGNTKNLQDSAMLRRAGQQAKGILLIDGDYSPQVARKLIRLGYGAKMIGRYRDFPSLVKAAFRVLKKGDVLLFSPGYTSFGCFANEFDRGLQFDRAIQNYAAVSAQN